MGKGKRKTWEKAKETNARTCGLIEDGVALERWNLGFRAELRLRKVEAMLGELAVVDAEEVLSDR